MELWIVGKWTGAGWEFQGVFDSEAKAVAACAGQPHYFVGPVTLNDTLPDEPVNWPGVFYPVSPSEEM